jgi:hypothetical protein
MKEESVSRRVVPKDETREDQAERLIEYQVDKLIERSRLMRRTLRGNAAALSPTARQLLLDFLDRDHALTTAAIDRARETPDFEFPPRLVDDRP